MKETKKLAIIICLLTLIIIGSTVFYILSPDKKPQGLVPIVVGAAILVYSIIKLVTLKKNDK